MTPEASRRWYKAGALISVLAVVLALMQSALPRWGRSLTFCVTLLGFLAVTRPSWDKDGTKLRMLGLSVGVFVAEVAILLTDLARD